MTDIRINGDISVEEAGRVLSAALGSRYKVITGGAGSELIVRRNPIISAPVHMSWGDGTTDFEVRGSGFVALKVINSLGIARTVRRAVQRGFNDRLAA